MSGRPPFIDRAKTASRPQETTGLWLAEVTRISDRDIWVKIPRLTADFEYGPIMYMGDVPRNVGDQIFVNFLEGRIDDPVGITYSRNPFNKHNDIEPEIDEFDDHLQYLDQGRGTALIEEVVEPIASAVSALQGTVVSVQGSVTAVQDSVAEVRGTLGAVQEDLETVGDILSDIPEGETAAAAGHTHVGGDVNATLDDLSDVDLSDIADNDVLAYDLASERWVNQTPAEAALAAASHNHDTDYSPADHEHELADLTDINLGTPNDSDVLSYSQSSGKWVSVPGFPSGAIIAFGGSAAPTGWLLCDGTAVSRTTYANLFAAISTNYGSGDGENTFNLPDLRQRFALGKAASGTGAALGDTGGSIDHAHSGPSHYHSVSTSGSTNSTGAHTHTWSDTSSNASSGHQHNVSGTTGSGSSHGHTWSQSTGSTGSPSGTTAAGYAGGLNIPSTTHTHSVTVTGTVTNESSHTHTWSDTSSENGSLHTHDVSGTTSSDGSHSHTTSASGSTSYDGTGNTGAANPPYVVVNYIIKT